MGKFGFGMVNDCKETIDPFATSQSIHDIPFTEDNFNELKERYILLLRENDDLQDRFITSDKRYRNCMDMYMDATNDIKEYKDDITRLHRRLDEKERLISSYIDMLNNNSQPDDKD